MRAVLFVLGLLAVTALSRAEELRILMEPDGRGVWREVFARFETLHPGVRLVLIEGPAATDAREDMYVNSLLAGSGDYDLVYADTIWIPKFAAAGWLEDLTGRWPAEKWQAFAPATVAGGTYRGRIYRVPTQLNGGLLYYRKDLLDGLGVPPPRTYAELRELSEKLKVPGKRAGYVWQGKQYEGLTCNFLEVLRGFGGSWIDAETGRVGLDDPEALKALQYLCSSVGQFSPAGVTTYAEEESRLVFQSGGAVFLRNWPYVSNLLAAPGSKVEGEVAFAPLPAGPGFPPAPTFGGAGFAVVKSSRARKAAGKFLDFISSPETVAFLYERGGVQPALKAFYETHPDPRQRALFEALQSTQPRPAIPQYAQASDILQRHVSSALTGQSTPAEALRRAARETRTLLGKP
jgi:multiple sugar transport system substrate-binding protein